MEQDGLLVSSVGKNIDGNNQGNKQHSNNESNNSISREKEVNQKLKIIKTKIYNNDGAPYIIAKTNLCYRPLKFLLDSGAAVSLLNINILENVDLLNNIIDHNVNIFGILGENEKVRTFGMISGILFMGEQYLGTIFYLVSERYFSDSDGIIGWDFLSPYRAVMDMQNMFLVIGIDEIKNDRLINTSAHSFINNDEKDKGHDTEENFLTTLANNYDFNENKNNIEMNKRINFTKLDKPMNNVEERARIILDKLNINKYGETERELVIDICNNFPFQFYLEGDTLTLTNVITHRINLIPNAKPVNVRQYRIPQSYRHILEEIILDYEKNGIIEKCQSPFNSPAILVGKKDKEGGKDDYRLVIDYKKLNAITEIHNFPIPLIDDILSSFSGCEYFSICDIKSAFHSILLDEDSRDFSAFSVNNFQYRWIRMPMGLSQSPHTWMNGINRILADLIGKGIHCYLDDIIVYAKTRSEHDNILWQIMKLLKKNNLQLKISKCKFLTSQFTYLGHIVSKDGIKANKDKVKAITQFEKPINIKKLQSFIGICSFFRRYVKNFSTIAKPLTTLLKKDELFIWTDKQQKAFDTLKRILAEEVVLAFPDFNETFYLATDASKVGIGAVLMQNVPYPRPIYFFSKTLNDAQRNYSVIELELLAIVAAVKAFRVYLYGRYFVLITDHRALTYLFSMKDCGSRLFRQRIELMEYNFKIIYRPGSQNQLCDTLSRLETSEPLSIEETLDLENKKICAITRSMAHDKTSTENNDDHPSVVMNNNNTENQSAIEGNNAISKYFIEEKSGTLLRKGDFNLVFFLVPIENDVLKNKLTDKFGVMNIKREFHSIGKHLHAITISNQFANAMNETNTKLCIDEIVKICSKSKANNIAVNIDYDNIRHYLYFKNVFEQRVAPSNIRATFFLNKVIELKELEDIDKILNIYHSSRLGGHCRTEKMYKTISQFYRWSNMKNSIARYCEKCSICEKTKTYTNVKVPMEVTSQGQMLFDHTFIDFVGPILPSANNNKYLFTAICDLTKFLVIVPTEDCTALTAAKCLLEHVICRYNFPSRLISDNATSFTSKVIQEITKLFQIKKIFATCYHAQSNKVERSHRFISSFIRAFIKSNKSDWDELVKFAAFVYNNTVHSTTGVPPHLLAHGFVVKIPINLTKTKPIYNYNNLADITRNTIAKSMELAKEHLLARKLHNKKYYDKNASEYEINVDDMVLVKNQTKSHKFDEVYSGPFRVLAAKDSYITIMKKGKQQKIHKNLVKKALADYDNEPPLTTPIVDLNFLKKEDGEILKKIYNIQF